MAVEAARKGSSRGRTPSARSSRPRCPTRSVLGTGTSLARWQLRMPQPVWRERAEYRVPDAAGRMSASAQYTGTPMQQARRFFQAVRARLNVLNAEHQQHGSQRRGGSLRPLRPDHLNRRPMAESRRSLATSRPRGRHRCGRCDHRRVREGEARRSATANARPCELFLPGLESAHSPCSRL